LKPLEKGKAVYQIYLAHGIEMPPKELVKVLRSIDEYLSPREKTH